LYKITHDRKKRPVFIIEERDDDASQWNTGRCA